MKAHKLTLLLSALTLILAFSSCSGMEEGEEYIVTVKATQNGKVKADKTSGLGKGQKVYLTVTPFDGYELKSLNIKDAHFVEVPYDEDLSSFVMPAGSVTVSAVFARKYTWDEYSILVSDCTNGEIKVDRTEGLFYTEFVKVGVIPAEGFSLFNLNIRDEEGNLIDTFDNAEDESWYRFQMPECNVTLEAVFARGSFYQKPVSAGTAVVDGSQVEYVYFGVWPQKDKDSIVEINEEESLTIGANTYYAGSDGAYYLKCKEKIVSSGWSSGSARFEYDGAYCANGRDAYFKVEPVKWIVLSRDSDGYALLMPATVLFSNIKYYDGYYNTTRQIDGKTVYNDNYKESTIRAYLNGLSYVSNDGSTQSVKDDYLGKGFLQTAFTTQAQKLIRTTHVDNSADSLYDEAGLLIVSDDLKKLCCDDTDDKVFLLSRLEITSAQYGFTNYNVASQLRIPRVSDYAFASNLYVDHSSSPYKCEWILLRSPSDNGGSSTYGRYIVTMTKYGTVSSGNDVGSDKTGFLPVISAYIGN